MFSSPTAGDREGLGLEEEEEDWSDNGSSVAVAMGEASAAGSDDDEPADPANTRFLSLMISAMLTEARGRVGVGPAGGRVPHRGAFGRQVKLGSRCISHWGRGSQCDLSPCAIAPSPAAGPPPPTLSPSPLFKKTTGGARLDLR